MLSIVIPTLNREQVLIDTINALLSLTPKPTDLIIVDQTSAHTKPVAAALERLERGGLIRLITLNHPNVAAAMNKGLIAAEHEIVLFLDDDIRPEPTLLEAHIAAHENIGAALVAGRVIQPWQENVASFDSTAFHFATEQPCWLDKFIGANFSVNRQTALALGGFDENFVSVAYNYEAEFSHRLRRAGQRIYFEPAACVHHLKVSSGGTRTYGEHLKTLRPDHSVGDYYFTFRTWGGWKSALSLILRPLRAISTRHHLRRPWWIPLTLIGELRGFLWALSLSLQGPKYIAVPREYDETVRPG